MCPRRQSELDLALWAGGPTSVALPVTTSWVAHLLDAQDVYWVRMLQFTYAHPRRVSLGLG